MKITSPAFANNELIPARYTCDGEEVNPPLSFIDVPSNTLSLVLIVEDPDVPQTIKTDGLWVHWLIWNIPSDTKEVMENSDPVGTYGMTTGRNLTYEGPCPPDREHRYFFKIFALDSLLDLTTGETRETLIAAMKNKVIAEAELVGRYERG